VQEPKICFGRVIGNFSEMLASRAAVIGVAVVSIAVCYEVTDLAQTGSLNFLPNLLISILGQYIFIERLLFGRAARDSAEKRRYGSLFISGFISGLGVVVGLVLLVLPGVYLISRWSAASSFVVAEGMGGSEALGASWDATREDHWQLFLVYLAGSAVFCLLFSFNLFGLRLMLFPGGGLVFPVVKNLITGSLNVAGWTLGVAVYRCINPLSNRLEEVFA
jgi:hypothetical protein